LVSLENRDIADLFSGILASAFDPDQLSGAIRNGLKKFLHVDRAELIVLGENGNPLQVTAEAPPSDDFANDVARLVERCRVSGLPIIEAEGPSERDMESLLLFPIRENGRVVAALLLGSMRPSFFSESLLSVVEQLSPGLASCIQHAVAHGENRRKLKELSILCSLAGIPGSLGLDQMLTECMNRVYLYFNFSFLRLLMIDEDSKTLRVHPSSTGVSTDDAEKRLMCPRGEGPDRAAKTGEPLLIYGDAAIGSPPVRRKALSEICIPLKTGEKVIGVLHARGKPCCSEQDVHLLNLIGEHLSILIENIRSEERYRAVVESALEGVMVLSDDGCITYANERVAEILGYPRDDLIGMDFRVCVPEESRAMAGLRHEKRRRGEAVPPHIEYRVVRKDRRVRNVEVSSALIRDSQGITSTVAFIKDVTERRRMEERLIRAEKLRAVGEMAGGVAHDFNTALTVILGNTQLLLRAVQDQEVKNGLAVIEREARESAETVRRFLEFTRKGGYDEIVPTDLNRVVREAVESTRPRWKHEDEKRGRPIAMILNLGTVPRVPAIIPELREVIGHLIMNAVEAMPEGGTLEIRTFERQGVCLQIADSGVGMTEDVQKRLFEPFFSTRPFAHTGLGLSMSYGVIRRLGGTIEVESRPGQGSTFTITLPIAAARPWDGDGEESGLHATILLIHQKEPERADLSKILQHGRHHVVTAENGKKGIGLFQERTFDMVLTNVQNVCRTIKKMDPTTPIGMIAGNGEGRKGKSKVDFLICPPFDTRQVLSKVAETLEFRGLASSALTR
jgi:PAS domain S-box-containing protein